MTALTIDMLRAKLTSSAFDLLPTNDYIVKVIESEEAPTRSGKAIKLTLQVTQGQFKTRRIWVMLNHVHPDSEVSARAMRQLYELSCAVGVGAELKNTEQLHDREFLAQIYTTPAKLDYPAKNSARKFRSLLPVPEPSEAVETDSAEPTSPATSVEPAPSVGIANGFSPEGVARARATLAAKRAAVTDLGDGRSEVGQ